MSSGQDVDMTRLYRMIDEMEPLTLARTLKGMMKKEANTLRKRSLEILLPKLSGPPRDLEAFKRMTWAAPYKKEPGFVVSVFPLKSRLYPSRMENKRGETRYLPLGLWLEKGTYSRKTRITYSFKPQYWAEKSRGFMVGKHALGEAEQQQREQIINRIEEDAIVRLKRRVKRYE